MSNVAKFIIALVIPLAVGGISGFFTASSVGSWYQTLSKPSWNPPDWLFGPVWTTLYIMMGIALYLVWKETGSSQKNLALVLFIIQLVLNFFWSFIFFNQRETGWALAEIIALWVMILLTILAFAKVNTLAAWLLVPYISWVSFASVLNYTIWKLN